MTRLVPPASEEHHVGTDVGRLRVLHAGGDQSDTIPLVLLHGGGTDNAAISWYRLIEPLSADHEVWALDLPGFGGSIDVPPAGGPRELAHLVSGAMTALGMSRAIVFGVSMGGDVALNIALEHADMVAGLVLVAPGGLVSIFRNRVTHFWAWAAAQSPDWLLHPAARFANRFAGSAIRAIVKDPSTLPAEIVDEFVREAREPRAGIAYGRYNQATLGRYGMRNDVTDHVHEITVPALIFHGENDPIVDPDGSRRAADRMPHARLVTIPECGHWAQLEAHDRFLSETRTFLEEQR